MHQYDEKKKYENKNFTLQFTCINTSGLGCGHVEKDAITQLQFSYQIHLKNA